jgi:hypothetical protein
MKATINVDKIDIEEQTINNTIYKGNGYIDGKYITLYIESTDIATSEVHTCVYNGTKFTQP